MNNDLSDMKEATHTKINIAIKQWYKELSTITYTHSAAYEVSGLKVLFEDVSKLRTMLSRLDTMLSTARRVERGLATELSAIVSAYEDTMDKQRSHPESLVGKAFAAQEREAYYRSAPELLNVRIEMRQLTELVTDVATFIKIGDSRYKLLDGSRSDLLLMTSLIKLGFNLKEIDK